MGNWTTDDNFGKVTILWLEQSDQFLEVDSLINSDLGKLG